MASRLQTMFSAELSLRPTDREGVPVELFPLGWEVFLVVSWSMTPICLPPLATSESPAGKRINRS